MLPPLTVTTEVYCLKGKHGFLSDSEWDGDSFSSSPINAWQYIDPKPKSGYECVKVRIIEHRHGPHLHSEVVPVACKPRGVPKTRYKCVCRRCGSSTKNMALPETAMERYAEIRTKHECITREWEYV